MWIRQALIILIGLSSGFVIAGGLYSFVTMVGVLTRLSTRTKTANRIMLYEDMVTLGATVGNCFSMMPVLLPLGSAMLIAYGLFAGIFTGCLAIALSEVLNVIPTFTRRIRMKKGLSFILIAMGLAKLAGTLLQLVFTGAK